MIEPHIITEQVAEASEPMPTGGTADANTAISVTFTNYSQTQWSLDYWGWDYQKGFSGPTSKPSDPLDAMSGQQTFAQDQLLSSLDQGPISIFCTWRDPNGYRFGINLYAHFQFIGMGPRPTWTVMNDYNASVDSKPTWQSNGGGPSATYKWDSSQIPYQIVATPTSEHTSLSIQVQIDDLPTASM